MRLRIIPLDDGFAVEWIGAHGERFAIVEGFPTPDAARAYSIEFLATMISHAGRGGVN